MKNECGLDSDDKNGWKRLPKLRLYSYFKDVDFCTCRERVKDQEPCHKFCPVQAKAREECEKIKFQFFVFLLTNSFKHNGKMNKSL